MTSLPTRDQLITFLDSLPTIAVAEGYITPYAVGGLVADNASDACEVGA